jgi:uncharacterized metal-binding protein YceD (DUF177 family)
MITPEFSRTLSLDTITDPISIHFEATLDECEALSQRLQVTVHSLIADITVEPSLGGKSHVIQGNLKAQVEQTCALTLEMLQTPVDAVFKTFFTPHAFAETIVMEEEDQEFYDAPEIDVGEVITQYLCLNIDQSPRREGVQIAAEETVLEEEPKNNPFANLSQKLGLDKV